MPLWIKAPLAVASFAVGIFLWYNVYLGYTCPRTFEASAWRAEPDRRALMAEDLCRHRKTLVLGKSRAQVQRLLGEPEALETRSVFFAQRLDSSISAAGREKRMRMYLRLPPGMPLPSTIATYSLGHKYYGLVGGRQLLFVAYKGNKVIGVTRRPE